MGISDKSTSKMRGQIRVMVQPRTPESLDGFQSRLKALNSAVLQMLLGLSEAQFSHL